MKLLDKILLAASALAAIGLLVICAIIYSKPDLSVWVRGTAVTLAVVNVVCTALFDLSLVRRSKKK